MADIIIDTATQRIHYTESENSLEVRVLNKEDFPDDLLPVEYNRRLSMVEPVATVDKRTHRIEIAKLLKISVVEK